ncbi:snRNA-activating protein complex subunit 1b [Gouania willdenowi]|uniref:snRNA-activating protein complex subunit 1-like n=1 Tax=Gouania willdenowi TaxID=441366 RepID=A0A8C5FYG8_GOUWI|nr:snRNA-activating protein complex subunit 1-like [Gouania willdenowi]
MDMCRKHVESDFEELLKRFKQTESIRYEVFSNIWKEMNFSSIFYGTMNREKRQFSRFALDIATPYVLPPYSFQIRVGGLYLLFGLFHSQTATPPQPIRMSLKDWENLKKFERDTVEAQHFDVLFILRRLESAKAFLFTAMPTLLTYSKRRNVKRPAQCDDFMERASRPQELITLELLEELSNIQTHYQNLKKSVTSESPDSNPSLNLIHNNMVPRLRSSVVDFYDWQQKAPNEDVGEGTSSQQCVSRAELIASIKSRAYKEAGEVVKSRRHRPVEVDVTSNKAGPSGMSGWQRKKRWSLKARTDESLQITGDMWKEATTTTLKYLSIHGTEKTPKNFKSWLSK